jgi:predicted nucleic acid-binding protein
MHPSAPERLSRARSEALHQTTAKLAPTVKAVRSAVVASLTNSPLRHGAVLIVIIGLAQSTRDEPDVDRHRLLGHGRTASSEDADRRRHRSPGDRSADAVCPVRARRRRHLSASRAQTRTENLGTRSRRRALQLPRVPRRTAGRPALVASLEEPSCCANLSAYDAQYVALAEALNVPLITADARVKRSGVARCEVEVFDAHT